LAQRNGTPRQAWLYATKEETRVDGPWVFGEPEGLGKQTVNQTYAKALHAKDSREAIEIIKETQPRDYCLYGAQIERNLGAHFKKAFNSRYKLGDFNTQKLNFRKATLVYGPSETGKTSFVLAHFKNPLIISHVDALRKLSPENDAIVFDDLSFSHWPPEGVIQLLDMDIDRDVHIRYGYATLPAGTLRVFTHNIKDIFYKPDCPEEQKKAIDRRLEVIHVPYKLYGNVMLQ